MGQAAVLREGGVTAAGPLVHAALELFGRKDVEQGAIGEITHAANVAKGTFYVHFQLVREIIGHRRDLAKATSLFLNGACAS